MWKPAANLQYTYWAIYIRLAYCRLRINAAINIMTNDLVMLVPNGLNGRLDVILKLEFKWNIDDKCLYLFSFSLNYDKWLVACPIMSGDVDKDATCHTRVTLRIFSWTFSVCSCKLSLLLYKIRSRDAQVKKIDLTSSCSQTLLCRITISTYKNSMNAMNDYLQFSTKFPSANRILNAI